MAQCLTLNLGKAVPKEAGEVKMVAGHSETGLDNCRSMNPLLNNAASPSCILYHVGFISLSALCC
jgi:hypothetical protein